MENRPWHSIQFMLKVKEDIWKPFSAYIRQFVGNYERPDVEKIEGLSPVIAIEQKTTTKNQDLQLEL